MRYPTEFIEYIESADMCLTYCTGIENCSMYPKGMPVELEISGQKDSPSRVVVSRRYCSLEIADQEKRKRERVLRSSRMPDLLKTRTFENFNEREDTIAAKSTVFNLRMDDVTWVVLAGPPGTGKTHLAAALMNTRIKEGREAVFVTVPELLTDIRRVIKNEQDTSELMEIVKNAELLILDDLGAERTTEWVSEQLFVLINARLLNQRQTVITTNYQRPGELIEKLGGLPGQRIVSRLLEAGDWIEIDTEDYRLKKNFVS